MHLEDEGQLIVYESGLREDFVGVEALFFGVLLRLCEDVVKGLQALDEGGDDEVVERGRHFDGVNW